ncbi:MAG: dihydroneopterin aldolase [Actinomycetota bacterium]|nr:dihydroneopterin aldolase [Actinomycetota bacterium]
MSDVIRIRDLRVEARVGVTDEERARHQAVLLQIEITADLRDAGRSDDLADTVDYAAVIEDVAKLVAASETRLLERLAELVAERIGRIARVQGVAVEITKVSVPVPQDVKDVSVRIER